MLPSPASRSAAARREGPPSLLFSRLFGLQPLAICVAFMLGTLFPPAPNNAAPTVLVRSPRQRAPANSNLFNQLHSPAGSKFAATASSLRCEHSGLPGGPACVFENLYLLKEQLLFAVDGEATGEEADLPSDLYVSHDMNSGFESIPIMSPMVVTLAQVLAWSKGAPIPTFSNLPIQIFSRLNPRNIYHHLWEDQMFAHHLGCKLLKTLNATGYAVGGGASDGGCVAGKLPPFGVLIVDNHDRPPDDERQKKVIIDWKPDWRRVVSREIYSWPLVTPVQATASGGLSIVPLISLGSHAECTHRRHCSNIIDKAPVQLFRRHLQELFGIVTMLPPPGAPKKAVLVERIGRRRLTNMKAIYELMPLMGYEPVVVGPFSTMTVQQQYLAFANASLAVFVFGAELGPAWVGLPQGACAAVLHPAGIVESLSYWVADKVGLRVATTIEVFKDPSDPRLDPQYRWGKNYSDIWLHLFNQDFAIDPKDLWRNAWCADAPWPPD
jgi:hypothetical protein